jgi:hypothetical protein
MHLKHLLLLVFCLWVGTFCFSQNGGFTSFPPCDPIPDGMMTFLTADAQSKGPGNDSSHVHAPAFNISTYQETNSQYCAYLSFLVQHHESALYKQALPDTVSPWLQKGIDSTDGAYLTKHYLRDAAFGGYPMLGVSADQVKAYCKWKSDRLGEMILIQTGLLEFVDNDTTKNYFKLDAFLGGMPSESIPTFKSDHKKSSVRMEDGIFFPPYRMPTADELNRFVQASADDKAQAYKRLTKMKQKKYDPKHHFAYLFPVYNKINLSPLQTRLKTKGLVPVQETANGGSKGELVLVGNGTGSSPAGASNIVFTQAYEEGPSFVGFRLVIPEYCLDRK